MKSLGFTVLTSVVLVFASLANSSCKKETKKSNTAPAAGFSLSKTVVSEGDTLIISNLSQNASAFSWSFNGKTYSDQTPIIIATSAGKHNLLLTATSNGVSATHSVEVTVLPDTLYRLSNNLIKTWNIKSIKYNSMEQINSPCQFDDEMTLYHHNIDTFQYTEGPQTCPAGTYIFSVPQSGEWRFNSAKKTFDLSLSAFGSPINLNFNLTKVSYDSIGGFDPVNKVDILLIKKP